MRRFRQENRHARSDSDPKRQCQVDFGTVQLKEIHLSALDEMGDDGAAFSLDFKSNHHTFWASTYI